MRFITLCLACGLSAATADAQQQTPLADPSRDSRNATGRTSIPEKIAPPLQRSEPAASDGMAKPDEAKQDMSPDLRAANPRSLQGSGTAPADGQQQKK
jgi:hypothetical protein